MSNENAEKLNSLIAEHGKRTYSLCYSYMGNKADADDAYQETFIKVFIALDRLPRENPVGWIFRIAINTCKDLLKKSCRKNVELTEVSKTYENFEDDVLGKQVYKAIRELPDKLRIVVILRGYFGYSEKETAAILGISQGTAASRYSRAKTLLKQKLEGLL